MIMRKREIIKRRVDWRRSGLRPTDDLIVFKNICDYHSRITVVQLDMKRSVFPHIDKKLAIFV